jgi:hypothetical protein
MKAKEGSLSRQMTNYAGPSLKKYTPFEPAVLQRASSNFDNLSTNQSSHYSAHPADKFSSAARPPKKGLPLEIPAIDHQKAAKKLKSLMKDEGF